MVWTPQQPITFLAHARKYTWLSLFHLIAVKGLRRGETAGLPWSHTRLTDAEADIRTQVVQLSWTTLTTTPKSEAGQRSITQDTYQSVFPDVVKAEAEVTAALLRGASVPAEPGGSVPVR